MRFFPGYRSLPSNYYGAYDVVEERYRVSYAWYSHTCHRYVYNSLMYIGILGRLLSSELLSSP